MAYVYSIGADEALVGSHNCCAFSNAFDRDADKYWVGGAVGDTTNWHNPLNWAGYSGGAGGAGVPSIDDNVYFDSNSNGYACIATAEMFCETFNGLTGWTTAFNTATYTLNVNGYLTINTTGVVTFTNSTINVKGNVTLSSGIATYNCGGVTWNFQSTCIYSAGKAQTGDYKKATIASGAELSILVGAFTIRDDGNSNLITLTDSTAKLKLSGGSIVLTANGTVKPIEDNGGQIYATTGYSLNILNTTNSTITLPKIDSGTNMLLTMRSYNGSTAVYNMSAPMTFRQMTIGTMSTDNITFNTLNFALNVVSWVIEQTNIVASSTITMNFGSSIVTFPGTSTYQPSIAIQQQSVDVLNLNLQDSQWVVNMIGTAATSISFAGTGTRNVTFNSSASIKFDTDRNCVLVSGGVSLPRIIVDMNSPTYTMTFDDASNFAQLQVEPNSIVRFRHGATHIIGSYTAGDWDGTAGNPVTFKSISDGTQHTLQVPTGISVNYVNVRDSVANNPIIVWSNTNVDSGNNSGWLFAIPATGVLMSKKSLLYGEALVSGGGVGNLVNKATVIYGQGIVTKVGSGTLTNNKPEINGSGIVINTGTGVLTSNAPIISGTGSRVVIGSGVLTSQKPIVHAVGNLYYYGYGELTNSKPEIHGSGSRILTGSGSLVNGHPTISGTGSRTLIGSGTLTNNKPEINGYGLSTKMGQGSLVSGHPNIVGVGVATHVGSGALIAHKPILIMKGNLFYFGFGTLENKKPEIHGTGSRILVGSGELLSKKAILYGEAFEAKAGNGVLNSNKPYLYGIGRLAHTGKGKKIYLNCDFNSYADVSGMLFSEPTLECTLDSSVELECELELA